MLGTEIQKTAWLKSRIGFLQKLLGWLYNEYIHTYKTVVFFFLLL